MKPIILRMALDDLQRGYEFYERRESSFGQYFEDSIFLDIATLERYAGIHRKTYGYYRMLARRFPYAIYYRLEGEVARIRAVLDCRQDPKWIKNRLQQRQQISGGNA